MFRVFRKSRESLVTSARRRKYATYALGEFILVVAGVLIALQLNDWNEGRKSREEAIYYLDLLHQQLIYENESLSKMIDNQADGRDKVAKAIGLLHADRWDVAEYDEFRELLYAAYLTAGKYTRPIALIQLVDTGRFNAIDSRDIQQKLLELNAAYTKAIWAIEHLNNSLHFPAALDLVRAIPYGSNDEIMALDVKPDLLLEDPNIKSGLTMIWIVHDSIRDELEALHTVATETQNEVAMYLSSRSIGATTSD